MDKRIRRIILTWFEVGITNIYGEKKKEMKNDSDFNKQNSQTSDV